jgi:hypothetical protein
VPTWQSPGVYPTDPNAVDMVNVDQFYDDSVAGFVRGAAADKTPFFFYFASHHTHAPQFAACQTTGDYQGDDSNLASTCKTKRGLFGDSLALLDRSVARYGARFSTGSYTRGIPLVPTPARVKALHVCDQCHSSWVSTASYHHHRKLCRNTEGCTACWMCSALRTLH